MVATAPRISKEYAYSTVTAEGVDADSVTSLTVEMAFMSDTSLPADDDWVSGDWESGTTNARVLFGAGSPKPLDPGTYNVWLRITGATERPVRPIGKLKVT